MDVPADIMQEARELVRRIKRPTVMEQLGRLLSDEELVALALLAERERRAQIAEHFQSLP